MKRYIKSSNSFLDDMVHNLYVNWDESELEYCKDLLLENGFTEIVEDTFQSQEFDDSNLNEDGGKYVCMLSFRIPEMLIRCRVEDRFSGSTRTPIEVDIHNKGGVIFTFTHAIRWLNGNGLPDNIRSRIMHAIKY